MKDDKGCIYFDPFEQQRRRFDNKYKAKQKRIALGKAPRRIWGDVHYQCNYCGVWVISSRITLDHVVPKSKGGSDHHSNLVASCKPCNEEKADLSLDEFLKT